MHLEGVTVDAQVLRRLPDIPGFALPTVKAGNHARQQHFGFHNGVGVEFGKSEKQRFVQAVRPKETWRSGSSFPDSHMRRVFAHSCMTPREFVAVPAWDALDRKVLRFNGYFKEAVHETNFENYRVRSVVILFYLEDETCQVTEPRQDNSGLPQGTLIRRHRFPSKDGGAYLKAEDIKIGTDFEIYGKSIRVTNCDLSTRDYYTRLGLQQGEAIADELDPFLTMREGAKPKEAKQPRTEEKVYREAMLGKEAVHGDMQQFLEKDRKVLRFYAVVDDLSTPQFERRPFMILFFLADDTVEIREMYQPNCGREHFPIFSRRSKMPRGCVELHGPMSQPRKKGDFVHGYELYVGQTVGLSGNQFTIYDADDFTRLHFTENGLTLAPKSDIGLPEYTVPRAATPPYTGYGSWDDSMASVTHLIPRPPKKDSVKLFNNEGKVFRFTARFASGQEMRRVFIFNFYPADDTLMIHEPPQRNLGIVTGRFLEKGVHMNQDTGRPVMPEDFLPGKIVQVNNHRFEMLVMDEFTRKCLENPDTEQKKFDLAVVMQKVSESMRQQGAHIRDVFRLFDSNHDGVLTHSEFKQAFLKYSVRLSDEETMIVMKHFDQKGEGQVSYNEFCDALIDPDYSTEMVKTKPLLESGMDTEYAMKATAKSKEGEETAAVRRAARDLGDMIHKRHGVLHKLFKEFETMTCQNFVSNEQIQKALDSKGMTMKIEDIDRVILYLYPDGDVKSVPYIAFFKEVIASYHDLSSIR